MVRAECGSTGLRRTFWPQDRRGELSMGGDPISLNQRVQGSSPCAPTIELIETKEKFSTTPF